MKAKIKKYLSVLIPIILGILTGLILYLTKIPALMLPRLEFLLSTIISCSATISGFILSSVSILVGATSSDIMIEIRKEGALPELRWRYAGTLILGLGVIFFFTFLGAVVDDTNCVSNPYLSLSAGVLVAYICSVVSTCYYLLSIIALIGEKKTTIDNKPSVPEGNYR